MTETAKQMDIPLSSKSLFEKVFGTTDHKLFWPVVAVLCVLLGGVLIYPEGSQSVFNTSKNFLLKNFSWAFLMGVAFTTVFALYMGFGKYGDLKLGKEEDTPEFSFMAWVSMLFSCGIGIGFIFWGVAEPLYHMFQSPHNVDPGVAGTAAAVPMSVQITILDWGLHGWALFAVGGFAIAFPAYRLGKPMNIAGGLYGLMKDKIEGSTLGRVVDGLGVIGTIGGNGAALGMGMLSITYALDKLFGIHIEKTGQVVTMLIIIVLYITSAATGIDKGIRILSLTNMGLAFFVLLFLLFLGPTTYLMNMMCQQFGEYFSNIVTMSFWSDAGSLEQRPWLGWWVLFYWLWWVTYIPFCGGFIARISKGRTLREYILGVLIVPLLITIAWFSVVGGSACHAELTNLVPVWDAVQKDAGSGIYMLLSKYPGGFFVSCIVLVNLIIFAVTTSDSASFFVAMQMSKGDPNPSIAMRLFWGIVIGMVGVLFQVTGGLNALKSLAIVVGAPFFLVGIAFIFSSWNMMKMADRGEM